MVRIRVLVVDDHRIFAESLAAALAAEPDVDVSAAGSGPAALRCLERGAAEGRRFDVLLVDMEHTSIGLETMEDVLRAVGRWDPVVIVRVPGHDPSFIKRLLDIGVDLRAAEDA